MGQKQKTEGKKEEERERERERLNDGNNNGQATHGARKPPGPTSLDRPLCDILAVRVFPKCRFSIF